MSPTAGTVAGPILLVGGGRMGGALLKGWVENAIADPAEITVIDPGAEARAAAEGLGATGVSGLDALPSGYAPALMLLAVKPQMMDEVVPPYRDLAAKGGAVLSIAAGRPTAYFTKLLGDGAAIVRAMPNTPAQVGRGVTALFATSHVTEDQRAACETLMAAVGEVVWLPDEGLMDAVTAVSGSGPAYVFHLIECLADAARAAGLPAGMADTLARATVTGAAELAHRSGETPAALREQVTSPGGTTAAALEVLRDSGELKDLMTRAVAAAARRSRELAG